MSPRKHNKAKSDSSTGSGKYHGPPGPRPLWSGVISFGLVSVPVQMFSATRRRAVSLRMLTSQGSPVGRRYYCPEHDQEVSNEHLVRGFPVEDGEYVIVHDEELDDIAAEKSREIDLRQFVDLSQVPLFLFERAYFLTPTGSSNKAYRLLSHVMERSGLAGIATFVMREKEHVVAIVAENGILQAETLRFPDEVRTPESVGLPDPSKPDQKRLSEFAKSIKNLHMPDLATKELHDEYAEHLQALVQKKQSAGAGVVEAPWADDEGIQDDDGESPRDLLEIIRRGLQGDGSDEQPRRRNGKHHADLEQRSKEELYERAKQRDIPGRSSMNKQQLIRALSD